MVRAWFLVGATVFAGALAVAQDSRPTPSKLEPSLPALPADWKKLDLTAEQLKSISAIQTDYRKQVADLEAKITLLKREERSKLLAVLTRAQLERLLEPAKEVPSDSRAKSGKRWSAKEEADLVRAYEAGASFTELANRHQRSPAAVRERLAVLGKLSDNGDPGKQR